MKSKKRFSFKKRVAIDLKKIAIFIIFIIIILIVTYNGIKSTLPIKIDMQYMEFIELLHSNKVDSVSIYTGLDYFDVVTVDGALARVPNPRYDEFRKDLYESGVNINIHTTTPAEAFSTIIISLPITMLLLALVYYLYMSVSSTVKNYFMSVKQSDGVRFTDVAGMSEIKEEIKFVVDFLKSPSKYREAGARIPKGILLSGPPGTGKTLLAKAIAGEADVPFISANGSDFIEMFVGLGARRVRELCKYALLNAPCVVFIDEIDAIGKRRSSINTAGNNENGQTLNALLQKMDGMRQLSGVLFIGATNVIDHLDPALTRSGRFDRHIVINAPNNKEDRIEIINTHLRGKKLRDDVKVEDINNLLIGLTGADIEMILNEAVLNSLMRDNNGIIELADIDVALNKLMTSGSNVKIVKHKDIERIAMHEAGHALVNLLCGRRVRKVSIVSSTSDVCGITITDMSEYDNSIIRTKKDLMDDIRVSYGGLVAEQLIYDDYSNGSSNDLQKSTVLIKLMVTKYGMGATLIDMTEINDVEVSNEMCKVSNSIYSNVESLLKQNKEKLIALGKQIEENEVLYNLDINYVSNY